MLNQTSKTFLGLFFILITFFSFNCQPENQSNESAKDSFPLRLPIANLSSIQINDSAIISGGYGSSVAIHPTLKNHYYLLTDRGPNYDSPPINGSESKGFTIPEYAPRIGLFKREGNTLTLVKDILIKDKDGNPLTGLPNPPENGENGEIPVDSTGEVLDFDPLGIDSEGLVAMNDGTFWISDEYGPYLIHLDENGQTLERISPFSKNPKRRLPKVMIHRRPNRGIEGLAITPDQKTLVGILQSPMYNPDKSVKSVSRNIRVFTFEIETGEVKEYIYQQDKIKHSCNSITAISDHEFLILERDGKMAEYDDQSKLVNGFKRIFKVDIQPATNINDKDDHALGLMFDDLTIELLSDSMLGANGLIPLKKTLFMDLLQSGVPYVHDKAEGIFYHLEDRILGVVNDNDFGVDSDKSGKMIPKRLRDGTVDFTELILFKIPI